MSGGVQQRGGRLANGQALRSRTYDDGEEPALRLKEMRWRRQMRLGLAEIQ